MPSAVLSIIIIFTNICLKKWEKSKSTKGEIKVIYSCGLPILSSLPPSLNTYFVPTLKSTTFIQQIYLVSIFFQAL